MTLMCAFDAFFFPLQQRVENLTRGTVAGMLGFDRVTMIILASVFVSLLICAPVVDYIAKRLVCKSKATNNDVTPVHSRVSEEKAFPPSFALTESRMLKTCSGCGRAFNDVITTGTAK